MRSIYKKVGFVKIGVVAAAIMVALAGGVIAMASSVDIHPEKDTVLLTSISPVTFTAGGVTISCEPLQTTGTIESPLSSSMSLYRAPMTKCSTSGEGTSTTYHEGKGWELIANSSTSASLLVGDSYFEKINGKCTLHINIEQQPASGTWSNGTKKAELAQPASTLKIAGVVFKGYIEHEKGEKCPKLEEGAEAEESGFRYTKVKMSGTFVVNDITHLNEPVELK